jgi:GABA permease
VGKYLVVANQPLGGDQLLEEVRRRAAAEPSSFFVVVPNTRSVDVAPASGAPLPPGSTGVGVEEQDHRATLIAQSRLNQALNQLRAEGLDARGDLGDSEPLTAIGDALEGASSTRSSSRPCPAASLAGWEWTSPAGRSVSSNCRSPPSPRAVAAD